MGRLDSGSHTAWSPNANWSAVTVDVPSGILNASSSGGVDFAQQPPRSALRQWEEQHKDYLEEIERKDHAAKREARERAEHELQQWMQDRAEATQKRHTSNLALQTD